MESIEILDPCTSPRWLEFVERHPDATIFHHPAWLRMLKRTYKYEAFAICLPRSGRIEAGIPFMEVKSFLTGRRWISVPFSDHCKPLLSSDPRGEANELLQFLFKKLHSEVPRIEIRWWLDTDLSVYRQGMFVLHELELDGDADTVFRKFKKTQVQQPILKAMRDGVEVKECETLHEFETFYDLQVETRRRIGVPAQPRKFFRAVWEDIIKPGYGFVLIASKSSKPIGGAVFFSYKGRVTYKYAASDYTYRSLKPNDVTLWEAIKKACAAGATLFDFGRSERSNEGLRNFKNGWGTQERDLDYTILSASPPSTRNSREGRIIATIIRNSPRFVCKLSGEILYKHFA
jgi:CelD/BcsL family acetyltransferase involved in cellulose biosynthesis